MQKKVLRRGQEVQLKKNLPASSCTGKDLPVRTSFAVMGFSAIYSSKVAFDAVCSVRSGTNQCTRGTQLGAVAQSHSSILHTCSGVGRKLPLCWLRDSVSPNTPLAITGFPSLKHSCGSSKCYSRGCTFHSGVIVCGRLLCTPFVVNSCITHLFKVPVRVVLVKHALNLSGDVLRVILRATVSPDDRKDAPHFVGEIVGRVVENHSGNTPAVTAVISLLRKALEFCGAVRNVDNAACCKLLTGRSRCAD
eukprot:gene11805-biopygen16890